MLDIIASGGSKDSGSSSSWFSSLEEIANGVINSVAKDAAGALQGRIEGALNNAPRSSNTAPVPDVTAQAASPAVSTFIDAKPFGVSLPVLVIGAGALLFLFAPKLRR